MDKNFIKKVGNNIRKYRKAKNFTQEALALEADIAISTIGMIETAKNDITLSKINSIAKALGIEPSKLLES